jgi:hypothetical protein
MRKAKRQSRRRGSPSARVRFWALCTGVAGVVGVVALFLTNVTTILNTIVPARPDLSVAIDRCSRQTISIVVTNKGRAPTRLQHAVISIIRDGVPQRIDARVIESAATKDGDIPPNKLPVTISLEANVGATPMILPPPYGKSCRLQFTLQFTDVKAQTLECACPAD